MNRFKDWLNQSTEDLKAAEVSSENQHYEWACFQAQQSAEKALKALLLVMNVDAWGHGLVHLLKRWRDLSSDTQKNDQKVNEKEFQDYFEKCQELDRQYIQPRYPNGFASGYPAEYYNKNIANECINNARSILEFVKKKINKISSSK